MRVILTLILLVSGSSASSAQDTPTDGPWTLTVTLRGVDSERSGTIGCALYRRAAGFPMDRSRALAVADARGRGSTRTCAFRLPGPGTYAVAALHDEDGDEEVDTNLFGAPTEGWATTRNVTHTFRAPSFEESDFEVTARRWRIAMRMHY
ncbi:MAG: DUF2141 domain-containing protein [Myxococcota bacterium]